jgi:uncharacterized coiled-coil protein SlyX
MKTPARLLAFLLLSGASLYADVPATINYQGIVSDSTGTLIGATSALNRKIIFRIYDASTGGNRLWTEEQTVTIYKGEFSVLLGNGTTATGTASSESRASLDTIFTPSTSTTRYLEVMVDNGDGSITAADTPISPRQMISTAAYAFHAKVADGIASATDLTITPVSGTATNYGIGWYGSGRTWNGVSVDGPVLYGNAGGALGSNVSGTKNISLLWNSSGQVGIGATGSFASTNKLTLQGDDASTPASQLSIRGNSDTNERLLVGFDTTNNRSTLQSYTAASTTGPLLLNPSGGLVGIGTSAPSARLSVEGSLSATGAGGYIFGTGGDTDGGLFSPADGVVTLKTNANERLRVDATGNLGIGTTSPTQKLHLNGGNLLIQNSSSPTMTLNTGTYSADLGVTTSAGGFSSSSAVGDVVLRSAAGKVILQSGTGAAAMTIASSNKVGIGTTSPVQALDVNGSASITGNILFPNQVNSTTRGIFGTVAATDSWSIYGYADSDDAGQMIIETANDGDEPIIFRQIQAGNPLERMRISQYGRLCVRTLDESAMGDLVIGQNGLSIAGTAQRGGYAKSYASMNVANGGVQFGIYGSLNADGWKFFTYDGDSNLDYQSDVRLKKDIVDVEPVLDRMMQVQFRRFHWKDNTDPNAKLQLGVIAQELQPLFPDLVTKGTEPEGYLSVGYGDFASIACKALQEYVTSNDSEVGKLRAQVNERDARIAALEAKLAAQEQRATAQSAEDAAQNAKLAALEKLLTGKAGGLQTVTFKAGK